jgi:hypothetical protein
LATRKFLFTEVKAFMLNDPDTLQRLKNKQYRTQFVSGSLIDRGSQIQRDSTFTGDCDQSEGKYFQ